MQVAAIIAAGGRGRRLGASVPKQLLPLAGRPILQWSVEALLGSGEVARVVVAAPAELLAAPPAYLRRDGVSLVAGGERRQDSVANAFDALPADTELVIIHDAARPLVDRDTIRRAIEAAARSGAAIAAIGASDTVKKSGPAGRDGAGRCFIERTLPRDQIFLAQTPQAFQREVLAEAIQLGRAGVEATDEAALVERAGHKVQLVEGSRRNIKITTADDLVIAEALVKAEAGEPSGNRAACADAALRVGCGYDLHRLVEGRPLILGGVTVPFERGLAGHSDADVLCHAITDAILGAAALGDIGQHFPDTDPRWKGASSLDLLAQVVARAREKGLAPVNVDVTLIAERPKLGPYREEIAACLARALCLDPGSVGVKAKTNEGVDATGRGEAIAAQAVVLLQKL
jgi:2-C-methyl-D-erythritol 4-phosphate cytidylyltransferase/2-C-methyl-D-erythritol 2,4-cyclodiphosphate synthase